MIITAISDTHGKHKELTKDLPGGDILICSGDISGAGYFEEIKPFCKWFQAQDYDECIFIAGNHDWGLQLYPSDAKKLLEDYGITYLQDNLYNTNNIKIYGSPWQPEFLNWAFNLPRNGDKLKEKWDAIPDNTDILITHGPSFGKLDKSPRGINVGCELLNERISEVKPKIHIFGHIHCNYGYYFDGTTHFINASNLNEKYEYYNKPITFDWNKETNEINYVH